jgi:hypothetical protein
MPAGSTGSLTGLKQIFRRKGAFNYAKNTAFGEGWAVIDGNDLLTGWRRFETIDDEKGNGDDK